MPPLKTYVFKHYINDGPQIIIKDYTFEQAMYQIVITCKNPADYTLISES